MDATAVNLVFAGLTAVMSIASTGSHGMANVSGNYYCCMLQALTPTNYWMMQDQIEFAVLQIDYLLGKTISIEDVTDRANLQASYSVTTQVSYDLSDISGVNYDHYYVNLLVSKWMAEANPVRSLPTVVDALHTNIIGKGTSQSIFKGYNQVAQFSNWATLATINWAAYTMANEVLSMSGLVYLIQNRDSESDTCIRRLREQAEWVTYNLVPQVWGPPPFEPGTIWLADYRLLPSAGSFNFNAQGGSTNIVPFCITLKAPQEVTQRLYVTGIASGGQFWANYYDASFNTGAVAPPNTWRPVDTSNIPSVDATTMVATSNGWTLFLKLGNRIKASTFNPSSNTFSTPSGDLINLISTGLNWNMVSATTDGTNSYILLRASSGDIRIFKNGGEFIRWNFGDFAGGSITWTNGKIYLAVLDGSQVSWWTDDGGGGLAWAGFNWKGDGYITNSGMMKAVTSLAHEQISHDQVVIVYQRTDSTLVGLVYNPTTGGSSATTLTAQVWGNTILGRKYTSKILSFDVTSIGTGVYVQITYQVLWNQLVQWECTATWRYQPYYGPNNGWVNYFTRSPTKLNESPRYHLAGLFDPSTPKAGGLPVLYALPGQYDNGYNVVPEVFYAVPTEYFANTASVLA